MMKRGLAAFLTGIMTVTLVAAGLTGCGSSTEDSEIPPYENPKTPEILIENEKLVLEWAEEYSTLQNAGCELWSFFIERIKNLTNAK